MKRRVYIILILLATLSAFATVLTLSASAGKSGYEAEVTVDNITTPYATLSEALEAAYAAADSAEPTVKLLKDVSMTESFNFDKENARMILDLNDKVLSNPETGFGIAVVNSTLAVVDNASVKTVKYYALDPDGSWIRSAEETERSVTGGVLAPIGSSSVITGSGGTLQMTGVSAVGGKTGSIGLNGTNASFTSVNFCGNVGEGAITVASDCTLSFSGCVFLENGYTQTLISDAPTGGGAICMAFGSAPVVTLKNCVFEKNASKDYGGAIFCPADSKLLVMGCTFKNNIAGKDGGAICVRSTAASASPKDKLVLIDTVITGNAAGNLGGGVFYEATAIGQTCFVAGTLISMADGTEKKVEEIVEGDLVKTFDHEKGCISSAKVYLAWGKELNPQPSFKLHFDGGLTVHCIAAHTFLEQSSRKYRTFTADNAEEFVGQSFFAEDGEWHELLSVSMEKNESWHYEFYTEKHQNAFAGGMLSAPADVDYLLNLYELDENLKADETALQADIEQYGLVTYDYAYERCGMTPEWFEAASTKYLFIAIGKGLVSLDEADGSYAEVASDLERTPAPVKRAAAKKRPLSDLAENAAQPKLADFTVGKLTLGKNVKIVGNTVGSTQSNVYLASGLIELADNHSNLTVGVTLPYDSTNEKPGSGRFTENGALADRALFFHDLDVYAVKFDNTDASVSFLSLVDGYRVSTETCQNGSLSTDGFGKVFLEGDTVSVTATPAEGYAVDEISATYNDGTKDCKLTVTNGQFTMPKYDVTVCASFLKTYTVTYETNGGSTVASATGTKIVFPAPNPTKDGCVFDGWYTDSTLKTKAVAGTVLAKDTTIYADWITVIKTQPNKDAANDYTVVVDDALTGVTYQWYQYVDGENDVALTGETNAKLGTTVLSESSYYCVVSQGANAIAESDKITPKKVSFAGAKGVTGTAPTTVYQLEGRSVTLPGNLFTADGGTFTGWSDGENKYLAGSTYTVSGDAVFTAKLEHACHNLVFDTVLCEEAMNYNEGYKYYELPVGNYYLASDLTLTANVMLTANTAICLNGHVLNLNGHSINGWGYDLILTDCQTNDAHAHYYKAEEESGLWKLADSSDYDKAVKGGAVTGGGSAENSAVSASYLLAEDVNFIGNGTLDAEKGGAVHVVTASIRRCRFYGNAAENGGALYADYELVLCASEFLDNRATISGGAVYAVEKARIEKCTLKNNEAGQKGGAALFSCTNSGSGAFTVLDTLISDNEAGVTGGGIAFAKAGCFAEGTKITMADGTEKNIEEIKVGDLVKSFNHETGTFVSGKVSYVFESSAPASYFTLSFESGKTLNIYDCHDLFDKAANKYVTVADTNWQDFIGHEFYNAADGVWETLESVTLIAGEANYYSIYVFDTQNCLANGMLSVPDDVDFILNVYEFNPETLMADEEALAADLATYGSFTFEECKLCDSREEFDDANLQYKNLYIGKGLITAFDLNEFYYSVHGVDEFTKGIEGFAVILGKNAVIKNNKVGEDADNIALDRGATIYVVDGAEGVEAGVSIPETVGDFAKNVYTSDASKVAFTSDVPGLAQRKTASETSPATYTYAFVYIKEQPCKNNDYTVVVVDALTGVTYQWYQYAGGENDVALTGETNAKLGTTALTNASYYCELTKGGEVIATSDKIVPVSVSFAGGSDAIGTAPKTVYQLEGRTVTLPANTFTKTGYKFDKWGTTAQGESYTVGASDVTLTAAWIEKATLTIDVTAQESEKGANLVPYAVKCTETSTGFAVSYRKYTAEAWSTAAPNDIGVYQVRIERAEDDTYKAVDLSFVSGYSIYYLFTFSDAGATSGKAPNPVKSTVGLADFNPDTSALVSANTLSKEGFVQDGWLAEREGKLVKWETRGTNTSVVFYPCWKPVVNTLNKSNDFGVSLSGKDISYQWYAYTAVAFDDIDSENYAFVYGIYDAQTKTISSTGDAGMNIICVLLDPDFASTASYLSCKLTCDEETDYYDFEQNYLNPDVSLLYRVNVIDVDGDLYLYVCSFAPFSASDLTLYVPTALSGETKNKIATVSAADVVCRVSYINRVGELTFVSSTLSNTVTPVKVSFAGGTGATGDAPTALYQLEGRKVTLPANTFTKTGYKFDKWGTTAQGESYTVGASDVTLTAAWTEKTAVSIAETAQTVTYNGNAQGFALLGTHKDAGDFTMKYYYGSAWTVDAPENVGTYDVKITRAEDGTYASYEKTVTGGLTIGKKEITIDWVSDSFIYNGSVQTVTASYQDVNNQTVSLTVSVTDFKNAGSYTATASFANGETNYALPAVTSKNYTMAKANASVSTAPTAKTLIYDGTVLALVNAGTAMNGTMQYKLAGGTYGADVPTVTNAGTYTVVYKAAGDSNHNDSAEATVSVTVEKLAVNEPTVSGSYKYTGEEQTVVPNGVLTCMSTEDSLTKTEAGVYTVTYELDNNHAWAEGSDGILTFEIKALTKESDKQENQKSEVVVSTEEGFSKDIEVIVEVTVETSVADKIEQSKTLVDYYNIEDKKAKLERNEKIGVVFDVKLVRIENGVSTVIQPENIAPGTTIRVKMLIPDDVDVTKVTRILHVHAADDIEVIEFNPERIDENGYYEIEIDRLSEFAFVYERDFIHWIALALLAALLVFTAVLWYVCKVRFFKEDEKLRIAPIAGFASDLIGVIVLAFFALCPFCRILLGVNALLLALLVLLYARKPRDDENGNEKRKADESTRKANGPTAKPAVEPVSAAAFAEISLKDAIASAASAAGTAVVNKKTVAAFFRDGYGAATEIRCRENYISSGLLPLADTHYKKFSDGKKCFIYVYELTGGKVFFLVRANENTANEIRKKHPSFVRSAYPKTQAHDWYTMLLDDSFVSAEDVFATLAFVFENFGEIESRALRSSVDVPTARSLFTDRQMDDAMANGEVRCGEPGKEVTVNVDTLCENYEDGEEVNIRSLKEKKLISQKAKRIKILARGELFKKFTVVADAFSYDAAKMIVAVGGSVVKLQTTG